MFSVTIQEEVFGGSARNKLSVPLRSHTMTLADLIESKVLATLGDYVQRNGKAFINRSFVSEKEFLLNGHTYSRLQLDEEKAVYEALAAFQRNAFFVIVDGEPKGDLQEELQLSDRSSVHFMRLVPLVGG